LIDLFATDQNRPIKVEAINTLQIHTNQH